MEPVPTPGNFYGFSLAMRADGLQLAVGSPGEDSVMPNSGAAYVGTVSYKAPNAGDNDQLGVAVAILDDGTPFAGAILEDSANDPDDNSAADSGAAYRFGAAAEYIKAGTPGAGDNFGEPLVVTGDGTTVALGAQTAASAAGTVTVRYFGQ